MKTNKQKAEYAKWYYYEKKVKSGAYQSDFYNDYSKEFAREKTRKRKKYKHQDIILTDKITEMWRLTGEIIIPDENEFKNVLYREENIDNDDTDYIDINECMQSDEEDDDKEILPD